jgi:hypothetical protein
MGLIRNMAKKVVQGIRSAREEANHPGRPPGFKAADHPLYEVPEAAAARARAATQPPPPSSASAPSTKDPGYAPPNEATEGTPWYLKGEQADPGWDETNPGWEPGKKWEEPPA